LCPGDEIGMTVFLMSDLKVSYEEQACFVCGQLNPVGFKVSFILDGDEGIHFLVKFPSIYQGYDGIVHGGLISTVLDEVMANCFFRRGVDCLTTEIKVRFLKPVPINSELKVSGKIVRKGSRIGIARGWIEDGDSTVYAESEGKFLLLRNNSSEVQSRKSIDASRENK
jgi:uncharacterized protein (TIGR00369 family)